MADRPLAVGEPDKELRERLLLEGWVASEPAGRPPVRLVGGVGVGWGRGGRVGEGGALYHLRGEHASIQQRGSSTHSRRLRASPAAAASSTACGRTEPIVPLPFAQPIPSSNGSSGARPPREPESLGEGGSSCRRRRTTTQKREMPRQMTARSRKRSGFPKEECCHPAPSMLREGATRPGEGRRAKVGAETRKINFK